MTRTNTIGAALRAAFPHTIPILAGFLFLGIAYGIYATGAGFGAAYPAVMSATIFAGSMEFVTVNLLLGAFDPLRAFALALMVNARHLFYGISMLEPYRDTGWKKPYLIFGMCDESFSIHCTTDVPLGVDRGWFLFFITLLNQVYWVCGATIGGLLGPVLRFNTEGLGFVMTALFVVLFLEQWRKEKRHHSALIGLGLTALSLLAFGGERFLLPAMAAILASLLLLRRWLERGEAQP